MVKIYLQTSIITILISITFLFNCQNEDKINQEIKNPIKTKPTKIENTNSIDITEKQKIAYKLEDATQYMVDCKKSKVLWFCSKHKGYVKFENGKIIVVNNKIVDGNFSVCMDSITNIDIDYDLMRGTLENVLKSIDFFNVKQFPTTTFEIIHIGHVKDNEYCISGNLKILNISNFLNFHSEISIVGDTLIATSKKFTIDRTKWGITNSSKNYVKGDEAFIIPDDISFVINLKAVIN